MPIMPKFYLDQLREVQGQPQKSLTLSQTTIDLCLAALIPAEKRSNWVQDLQSLDDAEWAEAEQYLWRAINELMA